MAVAARSARTARTRSLALARIRPWHWLGAIVVGSIVVRLFAGWLRPGPVYFPDEYIYSELGRSIAEHGQPLIRGSAAHFPALLQPLLTAPAWLFEDVETSFRLVQLMGTVAMSLVAVPVFLLGRRLGLGVALALGLALLSVAIPDMVYAAWMLADPFAYPLVLAALASAVFALAAPSRRSQLAFVGFAALATLARVQFVFLPVCFLLAAVAVGLRERRLRAVLGEQRLAFGLFGLALVPLVLGGPSRLVGYYEDVFDLSLNPLGLLKWASADAMLVLYSSGWVLVPGALIGFALAVWRPRSRAELAFGCVAPLFAAAVFFQAGLYAANGADRIQERYFFYVLPLVFLGFGLFAARGWPHRIPHALLALALIIVSVRVPLAGFAASDGRSNSPLLFGVGELEALIGDTGTASLVIAVAVALLSLVAVTLGYRPRRATPIAVATALVACSVAAAGAIAHDKGLSHGVRVNIIPGEPSIVDQANVGPTALIHAPLSDKGFATEELFWNRSLDRIVLLPGAVPPDAFAFERAAFGEDGSLVVDGRPLEGPLLVDAYGATMRFHGAQQIDRAPLYRLLAPVGRPRLALYMPGRYFDGWLDLGGSIRLWPAERGTPLQGELSFTLSLPPDADPALMNLTHPGGRRVVAVRPGEGTDVTLAVCSAGPWRARFAGPLTGNIGSRFVSVRSTEPVFRADPKACR